MNFPEHKFDGVWANASLHHIPKDHLPMVLKKIHNLLNEGGLFFIKVKHVDQEGIRTNEKFGKTLQRYFAFYKPNELVALLSSAGFSILSNELTTNDEWVDIVAKR